MRRFPMFRRRRMYQRPRSSLLLIIIVLIFLALIAKRTGILDWLLPR